MRKDTLRAINHVDVGDGFQWRRGSLLDSAIPVEAADLGHRWLIRSSLAMLRIIFSSSSVRRTAAYRSSFLLIWLASSTVEKTGKPFLVFNEASKLFL